MNPSNTASEMTYNAASCRKAAGKESGFDLGTIAAVATFWHNPDGLVRRQASDN